MSRKVSRVSPELKKVHLLPDEERDFSNLDESEKWACLFFELAREKKPLSDAIALWRKHHLTPNRDLFEDSMCFEARLYEQGLPEADIQTLSALSNSVFRVALIHPEFPNIAWRQIPTDQRKDGLEAIRWERTHFHWISPLRRKGNVDLYHRHLFQTKDSFPIEDWSLEDSELKARFLSYLNKRRREMGMEKCPRGLGQTAGSLLQHLRVYRAARRSKAELGAQEFAHMFLGCNKLEPSNISRSIGKLNSFYQGLKN